MLDNRPYHFANWMLILQRWEPMIAPAFPSQIPFWIQLKSLPLHYWKEEMGIYIGRAIGTYEEQILTRTTPKVRVMIKGLQLLITETIIGFSRGEECLVSLEYDKLEKHCSKCKRLTHEVKDCLGREVPTKSQRAELPPAPRRSPPRYKSPEPQKEYTQRQDRYGKPFGDKVSHRSTWYGKSYDPKDYETRRSYHYNHLQADRRSSESHSYRRERYNGAPAPRGERVCSHLSSSRISPHHR